MTQLREDAHEALGRGTRRQQEALDTLATIVGPDCVSVQKTLLFGEIIVEVLAEDALDRGLAHHLVLIKRDGAIERY